MLGDAQTWIEGPIEKENVLAVVTTIMRKGKSIECRNQGYQFIVELWLLLRPLRPLIMKIVCNKPFFAKIMNTFFKGKT
ncbi:MAG: hypothetical protein FNP40_03785 [Dehalobacter sp. 4CP]|uniref:hypothetical protein n=1 Tax=Dehalobacter sp. CP TaxID=2594474 RepID=UPI0013C8CE66|nr:hypothetical protein [Dehalobacter sp. 4CP]